jgi:hypothetical protein
MSENGTPSTLFPSATPLEEKDDDTDVFDDYLQPIDISAVDGTSADAPSDSDSTETE